MSNFCLKYYLICIVICCQTELFGQFQICGNPVNLSNDCADACVVCELNGAAGTTSHTIPGNAPPGYCTFVVHSIRYFAFVAGSTSLSFNVNVTGCTLGNSIELGVYDTPDCSSFNLVSNCNTYMPKGVHGFTAGPLKIGCPYYIVIDGNGPASCSFIVTVTSGSATAPVPGIGGNIMGRSNVCEGETETYSVNAINGACEAEWEITNGNLISQTSTSVTVQWPQAGKGKVCLHAKNPCHEKNFCLDVIIGKESENIIGTFYTCQNQSYNYKGNEYFKGEHEIRLKNFTGCDSVLKLTIEEYPLATKNLDTFLCQNECIVIFGKTFCSSGNFVELGKMITFPFCDSIVYINIKKDLNDISLSKSNDLSCDTTTSVLQVKTSIPVDKTYWKDSLGRILDSSQTLQVTQPGLYIVQLKTRIGPNQFCETIDSIRLTGNSLVPRLFTKSPLKVCESIALDLTTIQVVDSSRATSNYNFYFKDPGGAFIEIQNQSLIDRDTVIFIIGMNGSCSDTVELEIKLVEKIDLVTKDSFVCAGSSINPYDFIIDPPVVGNLDYYYSDLNRQEKIDSIILITRDTSWYGFVENGNCISIFTQLVKVIPEPELKLLSLRSTYCENELITLNLGLNSSAKRAIIEIDGNLVYSGLKDSSFVLPKLDTGYHSLRFKAYNDYCAKQYEHSFRILPTPVDPQVICTASDSTLVFHWKDNNQRVYWLLDSVITFGSVRITQDSVIISGLKQGELVRIKFILQDSICGDRVFFEQCRAVECPIVDIQISAVHQVCLHNGEDTIRTIPYLIVNPQSGWNIRFHGIGIIDSTIGIFDPKLAGPGIHKIKVRYFKALCEFEKVIEFHVVDIPDLRIELDSILCVGEETELVIIGLKNTEDQDSIELDGAVSSQKIADRRYKVKWNKPGLKRIRFEVKNRFCKKEFYKELIVVPKPEQTTAVCKAGLNFIQFSWDKSINVKNFQVELNPVFSYFWVNNSTISIENLPPNTQVQCRLISQAQGDCSDAIGPWVSCRTQDCPMLNLYHDTLFVGCRKDFPFVLELDQFKNFNHLTYQYSIDSQLLVDSKLEMNSLKAGAHIIRVENQSDFCRYQDSVVLILGDEPQFEYNQVDMSCLEDQKWGKIEFTSIHSGIPPYQVLLDQQIILNLKVEMLDAGPHLVVIKDSLQCETSFVVEIDDADSVSVDAGIDIEIQKNQSISLEAKIAGNFENIIWSPSNQLDCNRCINPTLLATEDQMIYVLVENEDHCTALDSVFIRIIDEQVYIPNVISANGDGLNDYLELFGSKDITQAKVSIFDRWGELIFSSDNYPVNSKEAAWDGTYKNQALMPGVYVYLIKISFRSGRSKDLVGELTLIR